MARLTAVAKLPEEVLGLIERGYQIIDRMTNNPYFPTPSPTLVVFQSHLESLNSAEVDFKNKTVSVQVRNAALEVVKDDISSLLIYVQVIANANPANANLIITSSGFYVREPGRKNPQVLNAVSEEVGKVTLTAPVNENKSFFLWEISSNEGGTWTFFKASRLSTCTVGGLVSVQLYYFRYFTVTEDNENSEYSNVLSCRIK